jgi:hypothetical protein
MLSDLFTSHEAVGLLHDVTTRAPILHQRLRIKQENRTFTAAAVDNETRFKITAVSLCICWIQIVTLCDVNLQQPMFLFVTCP